MPFVVGLGVVPTVRPILLAQEDPADNSTNGRGPSSARTGVAYRARPIAETRAVVLIFPFLFKGIDQEKGRVPRTQSPWPGKMGEHHFPYGLNA